MQNANAIARQISEISPLEQRAAEARYRLVDHDRNGRLEDAVNTCHEILGISPQDHEVWVALANLYRRLGRTNEALSSCWRGVGLAPHFVTGWIEAATLLFSLSRYDEALASLHHALSSNAKSAMAWTLLGEILNKKKMDEAAEACYLRSVALAPENTGPYHRLAQLLAKRGLFDDAAGHYLTINKLNSSDLDAVAGLGQCLISSCHFADAEAVIGKVLEYKPDHLDARLGSARLYLMTGNFDKAWPAYEWRLRRPEMEGPKLTGPDWDGGPIEGKTIVVYAEQGFGDNIQFARYIPVLAEKCAAVIFLVPVELYSLCRTLESEKVTVGTRLSGLPPYDFKIPLLSVPYMMGTGGNIPPIPYFKLPEGRSASINPAAGTKLKVGIVWAGRPTHSNDSLRSATIETLLPLAGVHGVTLFSLQVGYRAPDLGLKAHAFLIEDVSKKLKDYGDTAVVIQQMDLVVCVDTSVAHMAGALGIPVWVLLPQVPDWRWMFERDDTPWYPTMKLFRQSSPSGWDDVVERIVKELALMAGSREERVRDDETVEKARLLFQKGFAHQQAGEMDKALEAYLFSVRLDCRNADLYNNVGVAMQNMERFAAAEACYRRAFSLRNNDAGLLSNLASILRNQGKLAEAVRFSELAISQDKKQARIFFNAGHAYRDNGQPKKSLVCYEKTLKLDPTNAEALFDKSLAYLQMGDFKKGFPAYETRWGMKSLSRRNIPLPEWKGEALNGKAVFLQDEQGFGDVLQFARFIPELKKRGAGRIVLASRPELRRLMELMPDVDQIVGRDDGPSPDCQCYAHLLSLPGIMKLGTEDLSTHVPYLIAPPPSLPVPSDGRTKIGLVWAGQTLPKDRSVPLTSLLPLMGNPNHAFYSLQVGPRSEDLKTFGADMFVTDLGPRLFDFAETAAALKEMDMVITIDTSMAHLSGGLGIKTFTLLLYTSDWRWFDKGENCPWYPTMTLFRQHRPNDWSGALNELYEALKAF